MAEAGVTTGEFDPANLVDDLLGNRAGSTVRIDKDALATQLANDGPLADALATLESQITSGLVLRQTWASLLAITPTTAGTGGEVMETDTGTHLAASATGYDGAVVPNAGRYSWSATWLRWVRIGDGFLAAISDVGRSGQAADLIDGPSKVAMTVAERAKLAGIAAVGLSGQAGDLIDGPAKVAMTVAERASLATLGLRVTVTESGGLFVGNEEGFGGFYVGPDGTVHAVAMQFGDQLVTSSKSPGLRLRNADGFEVDLYDGRSYRIATRNSRNLALTEAVARRPLSRIASLSFGYNHWITYGQSLSFGSESWPALSTVSQAALGVFMLGNSTRPNGSTATTFTPLGAGVLNPIKAVNQTADFSALASDAAVAAYAPDFVAPGEDPAVAAASWLRQAWLDHNSLATDSTREIVVTSCGVGGRNIAELQKGAVPHLYNRILSAMTQVKALATAAGKTYGVPVVTIDHGYNDYSTATQAEATLAGYKAALGLLIDNITADVIAMSGQLYPPVFLIMQTKSVAQSELNYLHVGQAQLELSLERPNVFVVGPVSHHTDKGIHEDSNGARWSGCDIGKVAQRVLVARRDWEPLRPLAASYAAGGTEILVDHLVPAPPLVFAPTYIGHTATTHPHRGYQVFVNDVEVPVIRARIVADTVVAVETANVLPAGAAVRVLYGGNLAAAGSGNLRDSDATVYPYNYSYTPAIGHAVSANIPALVGKPYPAANAAAAYSIIVQQE